MQPSIIPNEEMRLFANDSLTYANSYLSTLENSLNNKKHFFNNDLLYNIASISLEKYFVALLARYDWPASHHMPIALYNEALQFDKELTNSMKVTTILVGKFEGICSLDDFGYRTPDTEDLQNMVTGMKEIKMLVEKRMSEVNETV